ncbi:MAG: Uma2 family endonuclease [Candidatus Omnitrophica bacterium]|nr:Uma2 family endonuclease [Candidatus Omnitrophota bacterium]
MEILQGELIQKTPGEWFHNQIAYRFSRLFDTFCQSHPELRFGTDNDGFLLDRDPDTLLSPDASLFRARPKADRPWLPFAPEIAVEVLSPGNSTSGIAFKIQKYLSCGAEQVWIVDPEKRTIEFYFPEGRKLAASGDEVVKGEGIAEGLEVSLVEVFWED